jgi:hypothetical protein
MIGTQATDWRDNAKIKREMNGCRSVWFGTPIVLPTHESL